MKTPSPGGTMTVSTDQPRSTYVAVIGAVVGSRQIQDRASFQDEIEEAVDALNRRAADLLAAPLRLTGGDEMKTVLEDPAAAVDVASRISDALYPASLAWGVGRGPITTPWASDVGRLDGPCFHRARRAVEEASEEEVWGKVYGFSPLDDTVMTALLRLLGALRGTWTEHQILSVRAVRDQSQKEAARELGLTESGISKSLRRAQFHDVEEGERALRALLASYRPGAEKPNRPSPDGSEGGA